jgi:hypothetical protein
MGHILSALMGLNKIETAINVEPSLLLLGRRWPTWEVG